VVIAHTDKIAALVAEWAAKAAEDGSQRPLARELTIGKYLVKT
jgi:hypothetical protein